MRDILSLQESDQIFLDLANVCSNEFVLQPKSNIRHEDFRPFVRASRSGYPPWILKRAGLESSGRIPSS